MPLRRPPPRLHHGNLLVRPARTQKTKKPIPPPVFLLHRRHTTPTSPREPPNYHRLQSGLPTVIDTKPSNPLRIKLQSKPPPIPAKLPQNQLRSKVATKSPKQLKDPLTPPRKQKNRDQKIFLLNRVATKAAAPNLGTRSNAALTIRAKEHLRAVICCDLTQPLTKTERRPPPPSQLKP